MRNLVAFSVCLLIWLDSKVTAQERRFACWGSFGPPVVSAQCPRDTVIQVAGAGLKVQARPGRCSYSENDCGCKYGENGCNMPNVRNLCMGRPACRLDVTQQYIDTNRCQGFTDYMYIEFNCVPVGGTSVKDICSAVNLQQTSGFIRSPAHPFIYPSEKHCDCTLSAPEDTTISLTILDLDTNCQRDSLTLEYQGTSGSLCDHQNSVTNKIVTQSNQLKLGFDAGNSESSNNFWLKYEASSPSVTVSVQCTSTYSRRQSETEPPSETVTSKDTTNIPSTTSQTAQKPRRRWRPSSRWRRIKANRRPNTARNTVDQQSQDSSEKDTEDETDKKVTKVTPWWWEFTVQTTPLNHFEGTTTPGRIEVVQTLSTFSLEEKIDQDKNIQGENINQAPQEKPDSIFKHSQERGQATPSSQFSKAFTPPSTENVNKRFDTTTPFYSRTRKRKRRPTRPTTVSSRNVESPAEDSGIAGRAGSDSNKFDKSKTNDDTVGWRDTRRKKLRFYPNSPIEKVNTVRQTTTQMLPTGNEKNKKQLSSSSEVVASKSNGQDQQSGKALAEGNKAGTSHDASKSGESLTVTIIAACVIGAILLIVIIGVVVRFIMNRRNPALRQRQISRGAALRRDNRFRKATKGKSYA